MVTLSTGELLFMQLNISSPSSELFILDTINVRVREAQIFLCLLIC